MTADDRDTQDRVRIVEVGPRDGLQNEPVVIDTADKVHLVDSLVEAGIGQIEVTSFVRPDLVPQLSDGAEVYDSITKAPGVRYIALAPNVRGLQTAREAGVTEVAVFAAASDEFNRSNVGRSTAEALEMFSAVAAEALALDMKVRGYVSTVLGCPFAGHVPLDDVVRVVEAMDVMGCEEISLGDTIGVGRPHEVPALIEAATGVVDASRIAVHFHDTYGMGLANSLAAIDAGVRTVDTSIGGLGGCPFAGKGAKGNLATEDLVYALAGSPHDTGVDVMDLVEINRWLGTVMGRPLPSRAAEALATRST